MRRLEQVPRWIGDLSTMMGVALVALSVCLGAAEEPALQSGSGAVASGITGGGLVLFGFRVLLVRRVDGPQAARRDDDTGA